MPEGHSIHHLAGQFRVLLGGQVLSASSLQGRFVAGTTWLSGQRLVAVRVYGKHLSLGFTPASLKVTSVVAATEGSLRDTISGDALTWLHVHLRVYDSWRFTGDAVFHEPLHWLPPESENQEDSRPDIEAQQASHDARPGSGLDTDAELGSGLKVTSVDSGENVTIREIPARTCVDGSTSAPHEYFTDRRFLMPSQFRVFIPVGTVRLRLMNPHGVTDLSGPNRCELPDWAQAQAIVTRLGPNPPQPDTRLTHFVARAATHKKGIGGNLMDQNVTTDMGSIYRAEALFATRLNPFVPTREVSECKLRRVRDWLMEYMTRGVESGHITTIGREDAAAFAASGTVAGREAQVIDRRYYVYQRDGCPYARYGATMRLAIMGGRKLYWYPRCQR